jgi:hypothetical protein
MNFEKQITVALLVLSAGACNDEPQHVDESGGPVFISHGIEPQRFRSLEDMVSKSDLVVEGVVRATALGEQRGGGYDPIRFYEATFDITRVIAGADPGSAIVIESEGEDQNGRRFLYMDGSTVNQYTAGERAILHLVKTRRPDARVLYRLTSSQGKYTVRSDGSLMAARKGDRLAAEIQQNGAEGLRQIAHQIGTTRTIGRFDPKLPTEQASN